MRKKDIFAMIRQLPLPTWFMSLSAADTRWTDLLKMLAKLNDGIEYSETELERLTWQEKTKLVQKDPVTRSRYFDHRVQEFLNTILKSSSEPIGKVLDYFYRVEFQQRGSPHIHMLVWVENAPTLETKSEEEIIEFVDQYLACSRLSKLPDDGDPWAPNNLLTREQKKNTSWTPVGQATDKKLRPQPTKMNSFKSGPSLSQAY